MKMTPGITTYSPLEEKINIISHGIGCLLSCVALLFLVIQAGLHGDIRHIFSNSIFGASLVMLYAASTSYHSSIEPFWRSRLNILDHAAIYVLIAGTYTPFALVALGGRLGWTIFATTWAVAIAGIILKIFFTGRYRLFSTIMYVLLGWVIVLVIQPLISSLPPHGFLWLLVGGISYTVGAAVYCIDRINLNHAIFHIFVLLGSICHFIAVFGYVFPEK